MFRRALSVASAGAANTNGSSNHTLAPRPDVDLAEQRRMVAQEKAEARAKMLKQDRSCSLYGSLAPQEETRVMEFNRHSLRLLVLEAHNRQAAQVSADVTTAEAPRPQHQDPMAMPPARQSRTPVPEGHFDLTTQQNFNALLQDIDTLMAVAQAKPPQTRDRILNQTYEQLARLSLWNERQPVL